jgi:hypothetical protein
MIVENTIMFFFACDLNLMKDSESGTRIKSSPLSYLCKESVILI